MKLTGLAIEGYGVCRDLRLGRFNDGLNIIFGATGSGKTTVRDFIRGVLFGFDSRGVQHASGLGPSFAHGSLDVVQNNLGYRMSRDIHVSGAASIQPTSAAYGGSATAQRVEQLMGNLTSELFDTVFNVGFHDTTEPAYHLARELHARIGVPLGKTAVHDDAAYLSWQQETDTIKRQLTSLRQRTDSLTLEKQGYRQQLEQAATLSNHQLVAIDKQIQELVERMSATETLPITSEIADVSAELARIRDLMASGDLRPVLTDPPIGLMPQTCTHTTLYQRLDEIDNQIRRWRRVQTDIQNQRVRLRDEMLIWNDLTLDSDEHPYHNARKILVALEMKVDLAEHQVNNGKEGSTVAHDGVIRQLTDICQQMRDDIYGLCRELGHQYKHIRHKAAAAELKSLRRCYNEMGENTQRLIKRRESIIDEIKQVDPSGAEAVERSDHQFCHCAQHDGYLEARRRFVGPLTGSLPAKTDPEFAHPNLEPYRARMAVLERRLGECRNHLASMEQLRQDLGVRHDESNQKRDQLLSNVNRQDLVAKIENVEVELQKSGDQCHELSRRLDSLTLTETMPDPILDSAAGYLSRMSLGELSKVWLDAPSGTLVVLDRFDNESHSSGLSRGQKDLVVLSLCLAASDSLRRQGIQVPMLLDDVFAHLDPQRVEATFEVLRDHGIAGNQIVVFAKNCEIARPLNSPESTVFEMPETGVSPIPYALPDRQSCFPGRENAWESQIEEENRYFHAYRNTSRFNQSHQAPSYPLTKYPGTGSRDTVSPEMFEQSEFIETPIGSILKYDRAAPFTESSLIENDGVVDVEHLAVLARFGIRTVSDLLEVDTSAFATEFLEAGMSPDQVDGWQSQYWLMLCVPGMNIQDASILYACGIDEPEELDTIHSYQLHERIQKFLLSPEGRRFSPTQFSIHHINEWYRALDSNRSQWQNSAGSSRRLRQRSQIPGPRLSQFDSSDSPSEPSVRVTRTDQRGARSPALEPSAPRRPARKQAYSMPTTPMVQSFTEQQRSARPETVRESSSERKQASQSGPANTRPSQKLKFYLDLSDCVEAAPSIGPRTAERFEKVGVASIDDFLKQTAESMANKIDYKRISADAIRNWQHQTRLVCRVPNLRGHDAQLLVACGVTEPEELAVMQPGKLFDIIGPFSMSKEGLKIIRSGKQPDLDEITNWIDWAGHTRSLQAA